MEELEAEVATNIVRDILAPRLEPEKISYKRMKGYLAVLLNGDRYQTICRLYLNNKRRQYLGIVTKNKVESRNRIENLTDIYRHADEINESLSFYQHPEFPESLF
ncbi:hypothetical protein FNO01nite_29180 [Flavobacterium noncentrifugens]|uniref:hypothetical protein n=1 Tax=Flavobacterium noncentrifugens TaxID=1128970 RepID=UPI000B86580E|nr:hypothetical protein [Flavobacterium noncentrifugens]GEP52246.1 hypothetical protein FNO01nite_29180 [Flavobacterium noncentrifugens]